MCLSLRVWHTAKKSVFLARASTIESEIIRDVILVNIYANTKYQTK